MSAVTSTNALAKDSTLQDVADAISTMGATSVGNLSALTTTDKTSLVGAVNEVKSGLNDIRNLTSDMTEINCTITRGYAYRRGNMVTVFVDVTKNAFGWECVGGMPKPMTNGQQDLLISATDLSDNSPIMGYVNNSGQLCCLNNSDSGQYRISGTYATMD